MTKDEIIADLMTQLKSANERIDRLLALVEELKSTIRSMEESMSRKDDDLSKEKNKNKGLTKLLVKENERQRPVKELTGQEKKTLEEAAAIRRKARGNNGARRNIHEEVSVEYHDVYPSDPDFDKARAVCMDKKDGNGNFDGRQCVRYTYTPGHFTKHIYRIHSYSQNGKIYAGKTPAAAFFNSNYTSSFVTGLMQLRYMYAMPVERILHYFSDMGFDLNKPTAHHLLDMAAGVLINFYKAIRKAVLGSDYIASDETYFSILVPEKNSRGKGVRKGWFWVIVGVNTGLLYVVYRDGSRKGSVIYDEVADYKGTLQSDAAVFYKNIESGRFPNIIRIACLQHIKRKFIDCKDYEPRAKEMVDLINRLYHEEHKHKIGVDGWTAEDNLRWRQEYAPDILAEIRDRLDTILEDPKLLPKGELEGAAKYFDAEWNAVVDIFKRGDTHLDNNLVERINRYFSMSRRSSLFFGSHTGAGRAVVLYTLALSARMNSIDFFTYITDIIDRTATWQPNTPLGKYRDLLPDKWKGPLKNDDMQGTEQNG